MAQYRIYSKEQVASVRALFEDGKNKCEISRLTGIPRATLTKWIHPTYKPKTNKPRNSHETITNFDAYLDTEEKRMAYSFILGVYLCDGYISRYKTYRAPSIRLFNDSKYPLNTTEWRNKLKILLPENSVLIYKKKNANCSIVLAYSRKLLDLFPQYGNGKKHDRKLIFTEWQQKILNEYPEEFIRGCIQSDGCIYRQKIHGGYSYKRFSFVNKSEDIIDLFLGSLRKIGILKEKYYSLSRGLFVVQNFKRIDSLKLEKIIQTKE